MMMTTFNTVMGIAKMILTVMLKNDKDRSEIMFMTVRLLFHILEQDGKG
jgi:hypothetical protein